MNQARKPTAFQVHKSWLLRASLVLVVTCLVDGVAVWFTKRPIFCAVLIPGTLPLSMFVFVQLR
jgi:hypothetical protein